MLVFGKPFLKIFALFIGLRRARSGGPILTISMWYNVFPRKEVPFGGHINIAPNFGVISTKPISLGCE